LEANLIKKYQPKYNIIWRDDKNYFFVGITKEDFPQVFWTHQTKELKIKNLKLKIDYLGPFVEGTALKKTLRILRRIFPYYTIKKHPQGLCPWCHLKLCPGPNPDKKEYKKNINNLISVLKGKKQSVLKNLKKDMKKASDSEAFEKAGKIRDQIFVLEKVLANAKVLNKTKEIDITNWSKIEEKLAQILKTKLRINRIEAYDVSNIQGKEATGSMVTFIRGFPEKNFYRKFKIRTPHHFLKKGNSYKNKMKSGGGPNDIAMLKEILKRRLDHPEWTYPDLILTDGGKAQLNAALATRDKQQETRNIKVVSLAKKENRLYIENQKNPLFLKKLPREIFNLILQLRDEAHRFAISYHHKLRQRYLIRE